MNLRPPYNHEQPNKYDKNVSSIYRFLPSRSRSISLEIVHPQQSREDQAERRKAQGSGETEEVVQDGDCFGDDEAEGPQDHIGAEPGCPVDDGVLL